MLLLPLATLLISWFLRYKQVQADLARHVLAGASYLLSAVSLAN
jgi:hypothetical protein